MNTDFKLGLLFYVVIITLFIVALVFFTVGLGRIQEPEPNIKALITLYSFCMKQVEFPSQKLCLKVTIQMVSG